MTKEGMARGREKEQPTDFFFMTNGMGMTMAPKRTNSAERSMKHTMDAGHGTRW